GGRGVTLAGGDGEFHAQFALLGQVGDEVRGIDDLDLVGGLDIGGGDGARALFVQGDGFGLGGVGTDGQRLEVEDDLGDVFHHAGQGGELVQGAFDADL